MTHPNIRQETFEGLAGVEYSLGVSKQYTTNQITVLSGAGRVDVRAQPAEGVALEVVSGGVIFLPNERTIVISETSLSRVALTQSGTAPFTVIITQSNPIKVANQ